MSAAIDTSNLTINRAKTMAAMGMVERDYEGFNVTAPGINKEIYRVWRDGDGRVRCSCAEYEEHVENEPRYRCEHILAVKFHLDPPDGIAPEPVSESVMGIQAETEEAEEVYMNHQVETGGRVIAMPFAETLKELTHALSPEQIRQRVGWTDRAGREHEVDYVEWHVVADLLDRICPDWSHEVIAIKQIGDFVAVTASITIQGVTRQGVGTGSAYDEMGIKKAEHDALKRAAVKFGIARELYRKEEEAAKTPNAATVQSQFPRDPVAKTMADLVTPKQLVAIRAIANAHGINAETKCVEMLRCRPEELSRKAASIFIDYLKSKTPDEVEIRHAG